MARRVLLVHGRRGHDPRDAVARAVHAHGHAPAAVDEVQRGRIPPNRVHRHARALHHARTVQAADAGAARRAVWGGARGSNSKLSARAGRVERVGTDVVAHQRRRVKGDGGGVGHRGWSSGRATAGGCSRSCLARGSLRAKAVAWAAHGDGAALAAGRRRVYPLAEPHQAAQPRIALAAVRFSHQASSREGDARRETDLLPAQHRLPRQGVHHARAPQPPRLGHMPRRARVRGRQATRRERVGLAVHPSR